MNPTPPVDEEAESFSLPTVNEVILTFKWLGNLGVKVTIKGRMEILVLPRVSEKLAHANAYVYKPKYCSSKSSNLYGFLIFSNWTLYLGKSLFETNYQAILHPSLQKCHRSRMLPIQSIFFKQKFIQYQKKKILTVAESPLKSLDKNQYVFHPVAAYLLIFVWDFLFSKMA